jgi:hypothetical protein
MRAIRGRHGERNTEKTVHISSNKNQTWWMQEFSLKTDKPPRAMEDASRRSRVGGAAVDKPSLRMDEEPIRDSSIV